MQFDTKEKLAEYAIKYYLENNKLPEVSKSEINKKLHQKAASFVTVYVSGKLRGCIGNAVAVGPLYKSIIENAVAAVSEDDRFFPIQKEELTKLKIEVSVLSPLKKYQPENPDKLLEFLKKDRPGLVIGKFGRRALFLPQVWKELPDPEEFLLNLCYKAGLGSDAWKENTDFWIFYNQKI